MLESRFSFADDEVDGAVAGEPVVGESPSGVRSASSFLNFQIRSFHPQIAPWSAVDPAGYVDGMNAYVLGGGDPVNPVKPVSLTENDGD